MYTCAWTSVVEGVELGGAGKWHIYIVHYGAPEVRDVGAVAAPGGRCRAALRPHLHLGNTQQPIVKTLTHFNFFCKLVSGGLGAEIKIN